MSASQTSKCMNISSREYSEHEPDQITIWIEHLTKYSEHELDTCLFGKVFNPNSYYTSNIVQSYLLDLVLSKSGYLLRLLQVKLLS